MISNFEKMADQNEAFIDNNFGRIFVERSMADDLPLEKVLEANDKLAGILYGRHIKKIIEDKDSEGLASLYKRSLDALNQNTEILDDVDLSKIGIVVVRPESMDELSACVQLLNDFGLSIIYDKSTYVSFDEYFMMYKHGLVDWNSTHDFPTRTLNYINKKLKVMVVTNRFDTLVSVSDYLTSELKGKQGIFKPKTLRGDIAFTALSTFTEDDGLRFNSSKANIALDPIGIYRKLVRDEIRSDDAHKNTDNPLLYYAAQGFHIPDSSEIKRDIKILLTDYDISVLKGRIPQ